MRKKLLLGLLAALLLTACTAPAHQTEAPEQGDYTLYFIANEFIANESRPDGSVLATESRDLPPESEPARGLLELLLAGPEDPALGSPFPAGTTLRGLSMEEGTAHVDLSEAYGGLTGVDLTLADGCVVLTLCQLEEVEAVYLTVEGRPRPFRDQVFTPTDFLLDNAFPQGVPQETEGPEEDVEDVDGSEEPEETPEEPVETPE